MKLIHFSAIAILIAGIYTAKAQTSPDADFYKKAAEGGMAEVQLGKLAQEKSSTDSVKQFGAMMVSDHTAANNKLKALAEQKGIQLPTSPSVGEMASKAKLEILTGNTFDKSYIKGMVQDHEDDIKEFQTEAASGQDPDAKAYAAATLPVLQMHLQKIKAIAAARNLDVT